MIIGTRTTIQADEGKTFIYAQTLEPAGNFLILSPDDSPENYTEIDDLSQDGEG